MNFNPHKSDLPVKEIIPEVRNYLSTHNTLIVKAPPGAGKSTLLPLALLNQKWLENQKILMLEPRRLAARSIATRMSDLLGEDVGDTVGFRIRFENKVSDKTKIEVITEGILTRILQNDNALEGIGMIIFDEFHERNIHADIALALGREAQQVLRPDLRILIMSATLNMPQLNEFFQSPVCESTGRQYPVEIEFTGNVDLMMLPEIAASIVIKATKENEGDILVFLPGEREIKACEEILRKKLNNFHIHPLYGMLPSGKQYAAIMPNKEGKRKIVIATDIAETSLTIEGITVVVDSGYQRTSKFDAKSGLSRLETVRISKESADQRAGRAGRLSPGRCYRMWTTATHENLQETKVPEILEADLASLVLDLARWGISDSSKLSWVTSPPQGAMSQAYDLLHQLNALEDRKITEHGKQIQNLPCHPRIAHMLLMAEGDEQTALATDIAAILEERDPLAKEVGIDINLRIEALRRFRNNTGKGKRFNRIEKIAQQYRRMLNIEVDNSLVDPFETGILLSYAYPERIAHARPGNNAQFQLANGKIAMAGHKDSLAHEAWLVVANLNARDGMGKIFLASPLNPSDLAPLVKEQENITWDTRKGGIIATKDLRIGNIILQSKPIHSPDKQKIIQAIIDVVKKEGEVLLNFDENVTQWQNRVLSLGKWRPEDLWPDVSTSTLLATSAKWLTPYLNDVRKSEDLKRLDLVKILHHHLDWEKQELLDKLAPERIQVQTGSRIRLKYQPDGEAPILAVRLQEVFGLTDTPRINDGSTPVLMHLLSPGYKPVQVTSDLKSFWNNAYYDVKKDLRARYPKHAWPDDPWNAKAVRK